MSTLSSTCVKLLSYNQVSNPVALPPTSPPSPSLYSGLSPLWPVAKAAAGIAVTCGVAYVSKKVLEHLRGPDAKSGRATLSTVHRCAVPTLTAALDSTLPPSVILAVTRPASAVVKAPAPAPAPAPALAPTPIAPTSAIGTATLLAATETVPTAAAAESAPVPSIAPTSVVAPSSALQLQCVAASLPALPSTSAPAELKVAIAAEPEHVPTPERAPVPLLALKSVMVQASTAPGPLFVGQGTTPPTSPVSPVRGRVTGRVASAYVYALTGCAGIAVRSLDVLVGGQVRASGLPRYNFIIVDSTMKSIDVGKYRTQLCSMRLTSGRDGIILASTVDNNAALFTPRVQVSTYSRIQGDGRVLNAIDQGDGIAAVFAEATGLPGVRLMHYCAEGHGDHRFRLIVASQYTLNADRDARRSLVVEHLPHVVLAADDMEQVVGIKPGDILYVGSTELTVESIERVMSKADTATGQPVSLVLANVVGDNTPASSIAIDDSVGRVACR